MLQVSAICFLHRALEPNGIGHLALLTQRLTFLRGLGSLGEWTSKTVSILAAKRDRKKRSHSAAGDSSEGGATSSAQLTSIHELSNMDEQALMELSQRINRAVVAKTTRK